MRSKNAGIVPELLLVYIKTKYGQVQIQKFKRGAAQTGLLLEDFDQLFIPVFGKMFQNQICQLVRSIYEYTQQAVSVYEDAQQYLTKVISFNTISESTISVQNFGDSFKVTGRLDAEYYQPKYNVLFETLATLKTKSLEATMVLQKSQNLLNQVAKHIEMKGFHLFV